MLFFVSFAVESLKSEKQSTYPRAGLILRTSSFKDSNRSRETTPEDEEYTRTVKSERTTVSSSGETFLTNRSRVKGVQDVISRMKATGRHLKKAKKSRFNFFVNFFPCRFEGGRLAGGHRGAHVTQQIPRLPSAALWHGIGPRFNCFHPTDENNGNGTTCNENNVHRNGIWILIGDFVALFVSARVRCCRKRWNA